MIALTGPSFSTTALAHRQSTLAWYDRRNDPADQFWDIYTARSTDGGASFIEMPINDVSFATPLGTWMGEYLGLVVDSDHGYVAWTSSIGDFNGDVYFDKFANSQQQAIPEASTLTLLIVGGVCLLRRSRRRMVPLASRQWHQSPWPIREFPRSHALRGNALSRRFATLKRNSP